MKPHRELHPLVPRLNLLNTIIGHKFGGAWCAYTVVPGGDEQIYGFQVYPTDHAEVRRYVADIAPTLGIPIRYPHRSDGMQLYLGPDQTTPEQLAAALNMLSN